VPDGEGVARDVTRDPVPVGDRLDILRTHSEAVAHRPGGGEPPLPVPGRPHRRPPGPQRTTAWPRRRRPPDRRAGGDELTNAELAAQASLAQPTLGTGTSTRSHAPASATWHTCSPHRSRSAPGTMPRRPSTSVQAGSAPSPPGRTTALLRRVLRQITSDGAGSPESIIDAGEQLGLVLDEAG
jgi:hypothetical protein